MVGLKCLDSPENKVGFKCLNSPENMVSFKCLDSPENMVSFKGAGGSSSKFLRNRLYSCF